MNVINVHGEKVKTVNTNTHITFTPTHYKSHRYINLHITKEVKTTTVQDIPK